MSKVLYDEIRFSKDQSYKKGVIDGFTHMIHCEKQDRDQDVNNQIVYYNKLVNERQYGWESNRFCCYFWFVGWDCFSLGLHLCVSVPNIEIHIPFGFIRIGRQRITRPKLIKGTRHIVGEEENEDQPFFVVEPNSMHRHE